MITPTPCLMRYTNTALLIATLLIIIPLSLTILYELKDYSVSDYVINCRANCYFGWHNGSLTNDEGYVCYRVCNTLMSFS